MAAHPKPNKKKRRPRPKSATPADVGKLIIRMQMRKAAGIIKEAGHSKAISAASGEFFSGKSGRTRKNRKAAKTLFAASKALKSRANKMSIRKKKGRKKIKKKK